jgi:hypothetical protein
MALAVRHRKSCEQQTAWLRSVAGLHWPASEPETMAVEQDKTNQIALNVTRTRVTVLVFNLTIIAFMLSILKAGGGSADMAHLTSSLALFVGFCLTLLGLWWLLFSQNLDAEGLSQPWPFTLGAITTYLALSQTVTAFMHQYLLGIESAVEASRPVVAESAQSLIRLDALGNTALLVLLVMGGGVWALTTYAAPLIAVLKSPVRGDRRWVFAGYYFALQVPIYWIYARAWHLQYVPADQPTDMLSLFALQFLQPFLWFR